MYKTFSLQPEIFCESIMDLDITFDLCQCSHSHFERIVSFKVFKMYDLLIEFILISNSLAPLKSLYCLLVLSNSEYSVIVWNSMRLVTNTNRVCVA